MPINKIYIGFDTKPSSLLSRWKEHCKQSQKPNKQTKLYKAMKKYGIENCIIEVIHDNISTISELACLEIDYIAKYDSYKKGLNSTLGGDGLGQHTLTNLSNDDIVIIKKHLSNRLSNYNKNIKWADTTAEQRLEILKTYWLSEASIKKRTESLKKWYESHPEERMKKADAIKKWRQNNPELHKNQMKISCELAAAKNRKKIKVEYPDGSTVLYNSVSEVVGISRHMVKYVAKKTLKGIDHKGFRIWYL